MTAHARSFTVNPSKATLLGDGIYIRRWHSPDGPGVELGVRNGDHEFQQLLLSPTTIHELLEYLAVDGFTYRPPSPLAARLAPRRTEEG